MRKQFILLIFVIINSLFFAQGWNPVGARSMSLANASVTLSDAWSAHHNIAAAAFSEKIQLGVSYENRFSLKELQYNALSAVAPIKKGAFTAMFQTTGFSLYRSSRFGIGYALKLSENISAGVGINYAMMNISNYSSIGALSGDAGILAKIGPKLTIGLSVTNLNRSKLANFEDDRFSTFLRFGTQYKLSSKVLLLGELEKEIESELRPKGAVEYLFSDLFCLRVGASGNPATLTFGTGFSFKNGLKFDIGSAWNQLIGWSPHVGLNYQFNKKGNE